MRTRATRPSPTSQRRSSPSAESDLGRAPLLSRLIGLENEYAVRAFVKGEWKPSEVTPESVWCRLEGVLQARHKSFVAGRALKHAVFLENGGAFNFEGITEGPIEGATPECRGPLQALLYQRAQEALLLDALPEVEQLVRFEVRKDVEIAFVRNARDAKGNLFGPQENYDVEAAGPLAIWWVRLLVLLGALWVGPLYLILTPLLLASITVAVVGARVMDRFAPRKRGGDRADRIFSDPAAVERSWAWTFLYPAMAWCYLVLGRLIHRRARRDLLPHLVSRVAVIGTGTILDDGRFALSERAPFVSCVVTAVGPQAVERSLFELGHILKAFPLVPTDLRVFPRLFLRRQRLQVSSSEANRAQVAELLKLGGTALVLDLSDRGMLKDAPRLADPIAALRTIACDPTLTVKVPLARGGEMSALELQRWYQQRAKQMVDAEPVAHLEARQVVTLWGEVLDLLAHDPRELVGVLDWPTKKMLLDANRDLSPQARKKIAIRYHELGAGYFERFERRGAAVELLQREDIERAKTTPPDGTPAFARGHAIKNATRTPLRYVSWERIIADKKRVKERPSLRVVPPPKD